ncbi:prevent-host-death protein [Citrobacter portucalensis]|uniref:prevent-host-death protein n=1 Tax=Citrobacter portucalensis TaxID=1639133 RepID=UPI001C63BE02|nr:prevent-host-death protein [Citrobacter portucalensis]MBW7620241.1 prevent-host-death protein [Citrobacter portucalensis]MBW7639063.1 prevent-host-death protein [Citrobacter portucalensis]MCA2134291.1 prevent-host-death protein [Citrobacter portucalensis]MCA2143631.1 prevent-host-death protein [Citrobacter portucalensis]MCA2149258.1 prevent-host-death protein [Citrobacter portucalensis]
MNHHAKPDTSFSIDDDEKVEEIKIQLLKAKIQCAKCDIHSDNIVNEDNFFDELMAPNK